MAGAWGFESGKYQISMECGEQRLLPAVRDADPRTLIVANGFSCRSQIEDAGTGRRAVHIAELVQAAHRTSRESHGRPPHTGTDTEPVDGRQGAAERCLPSGAPAPSVRRRAMRAAVAVSVCAGAAAATHGLLRRRGG